MYRKYLGFFLKNMERSLSSCCTETLNPSSRFFERFLLLMDTYKLKRFEFDNAIEQN
jgi:hypothetical protein